MKTDSTIITTNAITMRGPFSKIHHESPQNFFEDIKSLSREHAIRHLTASLDVVLTMNSSPSPQTVRLNENGGSPASMQAFRATGTFPNGRTVQPFTKDVVAADEVDARHRVYSFFGSRHGVNRRFVNIETVNKIEPTSSTEPAVISAFRDTHDFSTATAAEEE